jgi:hypothetical protein
VMVAFPRRQRALVVGDGGGRHLQHRRGEGEVRGQNQLARNGSETVLTDEGGCDGGGSKSIAPGGRFLTVRWRNGKGGMRGRRRGSIPGLLPWTRR